jgi:membrane protein
MASNKNKIDWNIVKEVFLKTTKNFFKDNCLLMSASLSYFGILSAFPLILLLLSALSFILNSNKKALEYVVHLTESFTPAGSEIARRLLENTINNGGITTIISFITLIWILLIFFGVLESVYNSIWRIKKRRSFLRSKFLGVFLMVLLMIFTLFTLFLTNALEYFFYSSNFIKFIGIKPLPAIYNTILYIINLIFALFVFFLFNKFIPVTKVNNKSALLGGTFTTLAFFIARFFYKLYLTYYPFVNVVYGSLFTVIILITWLDYTMIMMLYGCELTKIHHSMSKNNLITR